MSKTKKIGKAASIKSFTSWTDDVAFYLGNIRDFEVLSPEEEVALFEDIKSDDPIKSETAREKLITANQRYVFALAKSYAKSPQDVMELVQEANKGYIEAIDRYDITVGTRFLTYATYYMRREIVSYITNQGIMVRSTNKAKLMGILPKLKNEFIQQHQRVPSVDELYNLVQENGIKIKDKSCLYDLAVESIDSVMLEDDSTPTPTQLAFDNVSCSQNDYEDTIEDDAKTMLVNTLLGSCSDKEKKVIRLLFGLDDYEHSADAVADELNLTLQQVNKIRSTAMRKLKKAAAVINR